MKDLLGKELKVGDRVVHYTGGRNHSMIVGTVLSFNKTNTLADVKVEVCNRYNVEWYGRVDTYQKIKTNFVIMESTS